VNHEIIINRENHNQTWKSSQWFKLQGICMSCTN